MTSVLVLGMGRLERQPGGLNRFVDALSTALPAAGVGVTTVTADARGSLPARLARTTRAARRAPACDVVDAHFALYAWWPVTRGGLRQRPLVAHVHGSWAAESSADAWPARRVKEALERAVYRRAARVVVLSEAVRDLVVDRYGLDGARVLVVPPGVDRDRFCPGPAVRSRLGLPAAGPVLLAVRRLVPRTGVDVLVDAVAGLPDAHLAVVGDGPQRQALEQRAAPLGRRVTFAGRVPESELADWYRSADIAVVPSRAHEGWGLVVDEALACGTPVVASRLGGLPAALARAPGSGLVTPGDVGALRDRLRAALDGTDPLPTPEECRAATEGRDWTAVARTTTAVYAAVQRPRVVIVGHCGRPSGAELALVQLAPLLAREVELTVVLGEEGPVTDALRAAGVCVDVLPLSVGGSRRGVGPAAAVAAGVWAVRLAALLRRRRTEVVHAWTGRAGLLAGPGARAAGLPLVWSARDRLAPDYLPDRSAALLRTAADRLSAVVVANSAETLATWRPTRARAVVVASPGVVRGPVHRNGDGPWTVATLSRLAPWKGHDLVVRAFAEAFPEGPQRLRVLGNAWFGEGDIGGQLRALAAELGVADRVDLVGHRDDVAAELATVDVVVSYPRSPEPFGQVVVDAMTAGRPVVVAAEGGPAATVTGEVDGVLVPPREPAALAVALRRLHDDPALARRLAVQARRTAERYTPERLAGALTEVYREVLPCRA